MMKIEFAPLEGKSPQFYLFMLVLFGVAGAGMFATYLMYTQGLHITGMSNRVPWGISIVMLIYYIGLSAGSLVLSAMSALFGRKEFKPFARIAALLAMLLLVGALMSMIFDWGKPDRVFVPFMYFNFVSMFSINGILYSTYIAICFVYLLAMFAEKEKLVGVIALIAVIWAVGVHSGTGAIFGFVSRELYESPLLPPSFITAALSSGTALMIILLQLLFRYTERPFDKRYVTELSRLLAVFILVVAYFLFVENAFRAYNIGHREAASFFLFGGSHSMVFWVGLIGLGIVVPALILFAPATKNSIKMINVAAILHVIGVLCERYIIVVPGQLHPADILPNMNVESVALDGAVVSYSISFLEVVQALGVAAIVAIAFMLGLRIFAMLPTQALMEDEAS
uniref:Hdr-like menaquinol-oxidizing enzyme, subunit B (HmeB) n=1 Tax=uncultured sulfate-reducing bacterium TaxID=153939 RepID=Q3IBH9_9BACT|nr:Hdr-like menaquinol-oxidizing enzyme, subunit B (HmeB) [uncultured sulfate-reducing bacterium]